MPRVGDAGITPLPKRACGCACVCVCARDTRSLMVAATRSFPLPLCQTLYKTFLFSEVIPFFFCVPSSPASSVSLGVSLLPAPAHSSTALGLARERHSSQSVRQTLEPNRASEIILPSFPADLSRKGPWGEPNCQYPLPARGSDLLFTFNGVCIACPSPAAQSNKERRGISVHP